jgi:imidazoleglycerol phosphate synthase glutamine amidotransferase subunit HisH
MRVSLLDYGAGNIRSIRNGLLALNCDVHDITCPEDIENAECIIFPGVGSFGHAMETLVKKGFDVSKKGNLRKRGYFEFWNGNTRTHVCVCNRARLLYL